MFNIGWNNKNVKMLKIAFQTFVWCFWAWVLLGAFTFVYGMQALPVVKAFAYGFNILIAIMVTTLFWKYYKAM